MTPWWRIADSGSWRIRSRIRRADSTHVLAKPRFLFLEALDWSPIRSSMRQRQGRLMIVLVLWNRISNAIRHDSISDSADLAVALNIGCRDSCHWWSRLLKRSILACTSDHLY